MVLELIAWMMAYVLWFKLVIDFIMFTNKILFDIIFKEGSEKIVKRYS